MSDLAEVIRGLSNRQGVRGALLASADGLVVEHAAPGGIEADAVAALAATLGWHLGRLGEGAHLGELRTAVLEYGDGLVVLAGVGSGDWLVVLARPDADIGPLLYDLRHHRLALSALL